MVAVILNVLMLISLGYCCLRRLEFQRERLENVINGNRQIISSQIQLDQSLRKVRMFVNDHHNYFSLLIDQSRDIMSSINKRETCRICAQILTKTKMNKTMCKKHPICRVCFDVNVKYIVDKHDHLLYQVYYCRGCRLEHKKRLNVQQSHLEFVSWDE